jgi:hypothetical protein
MALIINTSIGTSKGITDEAYIRIESFEFRKNLGYIKVFPTLYMNSGSAASASYEEYDDNRPDAANEELKAKNDNIAEIYKFAVTESITRTRDFSRTYLVSESVDVMVPDPSNPGTEITQSNIDYRNQTITGSEDYTTDLISTNPISGISIYDFAYPLLKAKLEESFGDGNVIDG